MIQQYAFKDPSGLVWCAEGMLENALLGDDTAYALYVDQLEAVLDTLTVGDLDAASAATRASLMPLLADPAVRAASIEMGSSASVDLAAAEVDRRLRIMRSRFVSWRAELSARIAAYRAATGRSR
jgi:hypothetical protein